MRILRYLCNFLLILCLDITYILRFPMYSNVFIHIQTIILYVILLHTVKNTYFYSNFCV